MPSTKAKAPAKATEPTTVAIKASIDRLIDNGSQIKAAASLTVGGAFAVHGIKVIGSAKGDFVSMPSVKYNDKHRDIFHAITAEARQTMNEAVMGAYTQKLAEMENAEEAVSEDAVISM